MYKHFALMSMVALFMAGCRSNQGPSVMEMLDTYETQEQVEPETSAPLAESTNETPQSVEQPAADQSLQQPQESKERNTVMILMKTSKGDITLELDREKAPKTVANFLSYVNAGHYNGTIFHRVINGFMIQGGGFDENMNQKPAPNTVENEANNGLKNVIGSIAMARTPDPHSASAQFFINVKDNTFLDYPGQDGWGYCVFGKVVDGMDVVNDIKGVPTGSVGYMQDVPKEPIVIEDVSVIDE